MNYFPYMRTNRGVQLMNYLPVQVGKPWYKYFIPPLSVETWLSRKKSCCYFWQGWYRIENVKVRPCGSVAQLAECSRGKREALGSSPGRATNVSSPVTFGGQCGFAARATSIVVPPLFRADSGTNLINQGKNVKVRPCGSVAQLAVLAR